MLLVEKAQIQPAAAPVNLATAGMTGDWVSLANYRRCAVVFNKGVGAASQDTTITLLQATSAAGAGSKALNFTRVDTKQASALSAVGQFTTVTQAAGNTYTSNTSGEDEALWVIDIDSDSLDVANGFKFISATVADPGTNSQIANILYILHEPRYGDVPLPSAIA